MHVSAKSAMSSKKNENGRDSSVYKSDIILRKAYYALAMLSGLYKPFTTFATVYLNKCFL